MRHDDTDDRAREAAQCLPLRTAAVAAERSALEARYAPGTAVKVKWHDATQVRGVIVRHVTGGMVACYEVRLAGGVKRLTADRVVGKWRGKGGRG